MGGGLVAGGLVAGGFVAGGFVAGGFVGPPLGEPLGCDEGPGVVPVVGLGPGEPPEFDEGGVFAGREPPPPPPPQAASVAKRAKPTKAAAGDFPRIVAPS